ANVQLLDLRNGGDGRDVLVRQAVARMDVQAEGTAERRGPAEALELLAHGPGSSRPAPRPRLCIGAGMQLDGHGPDLRRRAQRLFVRVNEQRGAEPRCGEAFDGSGHPRAVLGSYEGEPALRGDLFPALGHQRDGHGTELERNGEHVLLCRQLEVHARAHRFHEQADVALLDVPAVLPQVHGDPIRSTELGENGGANGIWLIRAACLAHGRDVVDVDVQAHQSTARSDSSSAARSGSRPARRASRRVSRPNAEYSERSDGDNRPRWRRTASTSPRTMGPVSAAGKPRCSRSSTVLRSSGSVAATASSSGMPAWRSNRTAT